MTTNNLGLMQRIAAFVLEQRVIVFVAVAITVGWGIVVAPFDFGLDIERDPVPVDAIPDIGENQQIVFTEWPGRSPQDVDDQITYPLTVALLGMPEVKTIRSFSAFGFSTVYIIFEEEAEFYWSRSRVAEKLASLPANTLPDGVSPQLGPDATGLGQIFWYTIEGRDPDGNSTGGWDLHEIRTVQDYEVRYALAAADGVAEVSSVGGFVQEYQVDVDPEQMRAFGVTLEDVYAAVRGANAEVGARTTEISGVEYLIRGVGFLQNVDELRETVVRVVDNVPVRIDDVANVAIGPGLRRGALDRGGAEVVGGVVVARYGANPMEVIQNVRAAMTEVQRALPTRTLADGTVSQLTIVPFYDRTGLIEATVGTLETALTQQILITLLVVMILMLHLRSSLLISALLPLAVLATFVAMKQTDVTANVVSLAGIAIAIGTMVDIGIVITENIVSRLDEAPPEADRLAVIRDATAEVAGAVLTAVATTVVSFLPVFFLEGAEGKLFRPLAFTKTYAITASVLVALAVIPPAAWLLIGKRFRGGPRLKLALNGAIMLAGLVFAVRFHVVAGLLLVALGVARALDDRRGNEGTPFERVVSLAANFLAVAFVAVALAASWAPLGAGVGDGSNLAFVIILVGGLLSGFWLFQLSYRGLLNWVLQHKLLFLTLPCLIIGFGASAWLGFGTAFGWLPHSFHASSVGVSLH
ncbi:MAG: Cu(I)/Ag(I) efflux system membrane protein CusA/SilA, partial [Bradymonadia bacterium]